MEYQTILTEEKNSALIITLNRPEAKNALNNQMWEDLCDALDAWDHDDSLRSCIITNVDDCFCAGSDLKELAAGTHKAPEGREDWGFAGMTKHYFNKPLIAAVRGKCLGGGLEMIIACDLAVASEESTFGFPEPLRGLTAAGGGALMRMGHQVPTKFANQLLLTAKPISALTAQSWGIINDVVPDDQVLDKALEYAQDIAECAPLAIQYTKRTLYETMSESEIYPSHGWDVVSQYEDITLNSEDAHEGEVAFAEKRKPVWRNR